jgi:hypothetical protein
MLQNDIGKETDNDGFIIPVSPITSGPGGSPTSPLSPRGTRPRGFSTTSPALKPSEHSADRFISFSHFLSRYWNHFPQSATRTLGACAAYPTCDVCNPKADPALVFGEILGVIKGSKKTVGTKQRCLDRETYLSSGRQGILSHAREAVYDLFVAYTKLKRQRQEYDAADRLAESSICLIVNR